jgi:hypothetical protein
MLRDNLVGLIEPMRISAGVDPLALSIQKQASDDRSSCLENPRPEGAESSLTETSPLHFRLSQHSSGSAGAPVEISIDTLHQQLQEPTDQSEKKTLAVLVKTALELSSIYAHMKWTIYRATGNLSFVTFNCPVIKIFTKSQSGFAALFREDVEVRFPLSRKAMLVLTHDIPQMENIARIARRKPSEAKRKFWMLPEIRLESWNDDEVADANVAHASHCTACLSAAKTWNGQDR